MGVDGLYKFINKNFPDIYKSISINDIRGKTCIIDGMQHIYSQLIYMRSRNKEIITPCGINISHIHGLLNSLTYYLKNGIIPIFIFDGKSPEIKKKKVEERKQILKYNLKRLKELEDTKKTLKEILNMKIIQNETIDDYLYNDEDYIDSETDNDIYSRSYETYNFEEEIQKINDINEEYKKIYKKSIILKDYYVKDWIQILELLGLIVIKAEGEADPLCAYILKNNKNIYGIISDDSDMLIFGAPLLMRKAINQHFTVIELSLLLEKIGNLLGVEFNLDNLIDFALILGTDYGIFTLSIEESDSYKILKYYIDNDKDYKKIIIEEEHEYFELIKSYYKNLNFSNEYDYLLEKPTWNKPKLLDLKRRLLELKVDEDYIDKNNEIFDLYYNKIKKNKISKYKKQYYEFDYEYYKNNLINNTNNIIIYPSENNSIIDDNLYRVKTYEEIFKLES
jgi:flap endonuclease-1